MSSLEQPLQGLSSEPEKLNIPLVVILGPTAVGKTEIAIQLAERFDGEIVSADSRLFYRGMDIGTAKPTIQERIHVPHHLIDVANPDETWSLAIFQQEANSAIHKVFSKHHLPFLVGGTGQFIRSIIEGWKIPPSRPNSQLREVLTRWARKLGAAELHSKLALLDPRAANSIDSTNVRRTIRALEVILLTGRRFTDLRQSGYKLYNPLLVGLTLPRTELYQRVDDRIMRMIECGFVDEVQGLLKRGYSPDLPTMSAIGYGEIVAYIQGNITLDEAIILMKRRTRVFIRRQANWFKATDPAIHWFRVNTETVEEVGKLIRSWLGRISWGTNTLEPD
jgi:tRNA dimethylallyltransferase